MKKVALILMLMMGMQAHALNKSQFVGDWKCTDDFRYDDGSKERSVTFDTINADGTMSQLWEILTYENTGQLVSIEHFTIKNRWHVKGDRFYISDFNLVDYVAYDSQKIPYDTDYQEYFKDYWVNLYKDPYDAKVKFINKDHFVFPQSGQNTTCVRLYKEAV